MENEELEKELEKYAREPGEDETNGEASSVDLRERMDEHEKATQELLQKAEQAKTGQDLFRLFLDAKAWHHQKDLIEWSMGDINGKKLEFLSALTKNLNDILENNGKVEGFYEDEDYEILSMRYQHGWKDTRPWRNSFYDALNSGEEWLEDYEEYLISNLAQSLKEYKTEEFRGQSEDNLLLLLERLKLKENEVNKKREEEEARIAQIYPVRELSEEEEALQERFDLWATEQQAERFGWAEGLFNRTYAQIVRGLEEVGSGKSIKPQVELLKHEPNALTGVIADSLSKISPEKSAAQVLPLLKDKDNLIRRGAARVLYRLEFGKIDISEEGVKYLERMYDLGEYNNPDYFVQRLTAEGHVGVFNEKRELFKYFNLGDLGTEERRVKAQVLDFTYDTLFSPKENETTEDRARREGILEEFQKKYFDFYNDKFFQETRVHFNNFSFKEQGWYLHFVENADKEKQQSAKEFVKIYGEDGFRTFLSLEYGDEMGDKILQIGKFLPERAAAEIFRKYGGIIDATRDIESTLRDNFRQNQNEQLFAKASSNLFKHGRDFLAGFSEKAKTLKDDEKKTAVKQVLHQLENIKTEVLLFAAALKTVSNEQAIKISEIEGTSLEIKDVSALTRKERQNMMEYYTANREGYAPDRLQATIKDFENVLNSENKNFYLLRFQENLLAFCRIDKQPNGVYFASFNVKPDIRKYRIGTALVHEIFDKFSDQDIKLDANEDLASYYEQFGFKTVSTRSDYHGSKVYHEMVRPKRVSQEAEAA